MAKPLKSSSAQPIVGPYIEQMVGANKGKLYDLSMDIMSIGRAPDNDIIFPSESVSRCHAFLKRTSSGWLLQDNQSKNGIKKNGDKVQETSLRTGDVIQIGDFVFKFVDPTVSTGEQTASARLRIPRPAPQAPVNAPAVDDAYQALQQRKPNWSTIQFAGGIAALVVISVLIGFKLRTAIGHWLHPESPSAVNAPPRPPAPVEAPPKAVVKETAPPKEIPKEPIDQNNLNEGRVVSEEVLDPKVAPRGSADNQAPPLIDMPPPPPLVLNDNLSKTDLVIQQKKGAARNVTKDLGVYLQEGRDYLKEGDFESAALAFRFALVIDPNNRTAIDGIRAAEFRRKEMPSAQAAVASSAPAAAPSPPAPAATNYSDTRDIPLPPGDRKQQVRTLLKTAQVALNKRSYQEAINNAERARRIEIRGETAYLNEAKQIIDRAKLKQKEDFDPFIARAKEKLKSGDFAGSRLLCEEMLRTDPAYTEARECLAAAVEGMKGKK